MATGALKPVRRGRDQPPAAAAAILAPAVNATPPTKKRIRAFSTTRLARLLTPQTALPAILPFFALAYLMPPLGTFAVFAVLLAIGILIAQRPNRQLLAIVRELHATLPWFDAEPVTRVHEDQLDALRTALPNGTGLVTVPCAAMQRIDDLAAVMIERHGAMRWPEDPARKAAALLAEGARRGRRPLLVLLQDADQLAARDADGYAHFLAEWDLRMQQVAPPVLLFVQVTRPAPPPPAPEAVAAPAGAPGAWWQPRPGELVD